MVRVGFQPVAKMTHGPPRLVQIAIHHTFQTYVYLYTNIHWRTHSHWYSYISYIYQISNIRRTLAGNKIVDHSNVVGASPGSSAPTTSSFTTQHLVSIDCAKTTARRDKKHLSLEIWCVLYLILYGIHMYVYVYVCVCVYIHIYIYISIAHVKCNGCVCTHTWNTLARR